MSDEKQDDTLRHGAVIKCKGPMGDTQLPEIPTSKSLKYHANLNRDRAEYWFAEATKARERIIELEALLQHDPDECVPGQLEECQQEIRRLKGCATEISMDRSKYKSLLRERTEQLEACKDIVRRLQATIRRNSEGRDDG